MTIDATSPRETQSLVRPYQRTFYPVKIPEQHHQLRHFISTSYRNLIYYASEKRIYALHLSLQRKELIASLHWAPQCLDARHGWICVGGLERGRFAYIDIGDEELDKEETLEPHRQPNASSSMALEHREQLFGHRAQDQNQSILAAVTRRKPEIHFQEFGGEIVNSVTIHQLRIGGRNDVVALITNNDRTIRIFSLTHSRLHETLDFSTPMNYATISPDGELMVAVGDKPQAFFCRRSLSPTYPMQDSWRVIAEPKLSLAHSSDCCFSIAFSPSGHICAVASQTGIITIFDTSLVRDDMEPDEAVLEVIRSSRPCLSRDLSGAVRSMSFGPSPWDLFAWAEDRGRVCVVDLRDAFRSRQTIELRIDCPSLERASISDLEEVTLERRQMEIEANLIRRHRDALEAQDLPVAVGHGAEYVEFPTRRDNSREAREDETSFAREEEISLTEGERHVLNAVRTSRIQGNDQGRLEHLPTPSSINYNNPRAERSAEPTQTVTQNSFLLNHEIGSIHEYMRQRNLDRNRNSERPYQPRRRSSVVISNGDHTNTSNSSHPSSLASVGTVTPILSASPSRLPSTTEATAALSIPPSRDPWITIVDLMGPGGSASQRREPLPRNIDRRMQQQRSRAEAQQQRLRQLHGLTLTEERARPGDELYDEDDIDSLRRPQESRGRRDDSLATMGIGWGGDGRKLYVGTEEGILEYTIDINERKTFPGLALQ